MHGTIIRKLIRYAVRIISHDSLDAINTASSTKYFLFYDKLSWGFYSIRNKFIFTLKYMHEKNNIFAMRWGVKFHQLNHHNKNYLKSTAVGIRRRLYIIVLSQMSVYRHTKGFKKYTPSSPQVFWCAHCMKNIAEKCERD